MICDEHLYAITKQELDLPCRLLRQIWHAGIESVSAALAIIQALLEGLAGQAWAGEQTACLI